MSVVRGLAAFLLGSTFLGLSLGAAQAITLTFGGGPVTSPPFPGYGTTVGKNNVINSPLSGNSVTDPPASLMGRPSMGTVGSNHAVATVGGCNSSHGYKVDWYYIGAESGYDVTLNVPGLTPFTEHNENNQCSSSCGSLPWGTNRSAVSGDKHGLDARDRAGLFAQRPIGRHGQRDLAER